MKIVAAGGGSGGHVAPVLAVINELNKLDPNVQVRFICDTGFFVQSKQIMSKAAVPVEVKKIVAGRWRRYHGLPFMKQFFYWPTLSGNVKDVFKFGIGFLQSFWLLLWNRPDVVFAKGGFVCVPVGLSAALLRIPLVIHDSDAHPGLTSRLLAPRATFIATGMPLENYNYPKHKTHYVGVPINKAYVPADEEKRHELKKTLGLAPALPLILATGGGTGALPINHALMRAASQLTASAQLVHLTGAQKSAEVAGAVGANPRYYVREFVDPAEMAQLVRAADVVVTRAGSTVFELAAAAKAIVIVPNPRLTGGHQLKNAAMYASANAAVVIGEQQLEAQPEELAKAILQLLGDTAKRHKLEQNLYRFAKPHAALEVAQLIIKAKKKS